MGNFCQNCGAALRPNSKFCLKCGAKIIGQNSSSQMNAPLQVGDTSFEEFNMQAQNDANPQVSNAGKKSFHIIPAIASAAVLAVVWIVQIVLKDKGIDNAATKALELITFARGGMSGGIRGLVGGTLGKTVVAAAIVSLAAGGAGQIGLGMKNAFGGSKANDGQKGSIVLWIIGALLAALLYWFFVGGFELSGVMVAAAGILVSLRSLGGRNGIIYKAVSSVFSKNVNGYKTPNFGAASSLMKGIASGFGIAVLIAGVLTGVGAAKNKFDSSELASVLQQVTTEDGIEKVVSEIEETTANGIQSSEELSDDSDEATDNLNGATNNSDETESSNNSDSNSILDSLNNAVADMTGQKDEKKPWKNSGITEPEESSWMEPLKADDGSVALYDKDDEFVCMVYPMDGFEFKAFNYDHGLHYAMLDNDEIGYKVDSYVLGARYFDGTIKEYYEEQGYTKYVFESTSLGKFMNGSCEFFMGHETYDWGALEGEEPYHAESYYLYAPYYSSVWDKTIGMGIEFSDPFGHGDTELSVVKDWTIDDWKHAAETIFGK